jgi:hypothetical protein
MRNTVFIAADVGHRAVSAVSRMHAPVDAVSKRSKSVSWSSLRLNTIMLYTFLLTEPQLVRVTAWLDTQYVDRPRQYILSVQHRLFDDLVVVVIDCDEVSAVWIGLMV